MLIALGIIHLIFPKYFDWKNDLQTMSLINRQMMYVHTLFIGLVVFLMGVLCLLCSNDIVHSQLGKILSGGFFVFWFTSLKKLAFPKQRRVACKLDNQPCKPKYKKAP